MLRDIIERMKVFIPTPVRINIMKRLRSSFKIKRPKITFLPDSDNTILNCMIAYNQYGGYCIPISSYHRPAVQTILRGKIHEPETIEYMASNCTAGDIIHAGTYFGAFLPALSKRLAKNAKIWGFEPNQENYKCAFITKYINSLDNVTLYNAGLGTHRKKAKMVTRNSKGEYLGGGSRIVNNPDNNIEELIDIDIISIDETIPKNRIVSIIQLDVEGYEKQALRGAMETIIRHKPILILEDKNNIINSTWFSENILSLEYEEAGKVHFNTVLTHIPLNK